MATFCMAAFALDMKIRQNIKNLIKFQNLKIAYLIFLYIQYIILTISISVLEWPILHTIHPFFILSMCSLVTTFLLPVAVMTMSTVRITSFSFTIRKPSMLKHFRHYFHFKKTPTICHEGTSRERKYSSYSFSTSALDGCYWSVSRPDHFYKQT
jgi:hypothetical protein